MILNDVIIGDVWLCSGQSNMYMWLNSCLGAQDDIAAADLPLIREVAIKQMSCASPLDDVGLVRSWTPASPKTAPGFTAVGFYFARKVYEETGIPIGLINASWGSTPIETWLAPEGVAAVPELSLADAVVRKLATAGQAKDSAAEWRSLYVRVFSELYTGYHPNNDPAGMFAVHAAFHAMIRPLVPWLFGETRKKSYGLPDAG